MGDIAKAVIFGIICELVVVFWYWVGKSMYQSMQEPRCPKCGEVIDMCVKCRIKATDPKITRIDMITEIQEDRFIQDLANKIQELRKVDEMRKHEETK